MHALVTGASGGLGKAYCEHLASQGHDLVLVSRREAELHQIADDLTRRYGIEAVVLPTDLGSLQGREQLAVELEQRGLQVDMLVNNAGFGTLGSFVEADPARMTSEIELNCTALTHLTRLLLPGMVQRHDGRVINVASTAAFQPIPDMAVYAATKAYVLSLTKALWEEVKGTGVRVTAICPGPTDTAFFDVAGNDGVMTNRRTPEQVVKTSFAALDRRLPFVVDGLFNRVQARVASLSPTAIAAPIARRVANGH